MHPIASLILVPLAVWALCGLFSRAIGDTGFSGLTDVDGDACGGDGSD